MLISDGDTIPVHQNDHSIRISSDDFACDVKLQPGTPDDDYREIWICNEGDKSIEFAGEDSNIFKVITLEKLYALQLVWLESMHLWCRPNDVLGEMSRAPWIASAPSLTVKIYD